MGADRVPTGGSGPWRPDGRLGCRQEVGWEADAQVSAQMSWIPCPPETRWPGVCKPVSEWAEPRLFNHCHPQGGRMEVTLVDLPELPLGSCPLGEAGWTAHQAQGTGAQGLQTSWCGPKGCP